MDARDPIATTELADSLSAAFLILLERLTPTQRAAYLLREVFGYDYAEVARILETSEANCRQLVQRGKQGIWTGRPRFTRDAGAARDLARRFLDACTTGDMAALVTLLADDAVAWADGGGKFAPARRPVVGANRVARFLAAVVGTWRAAREGRVEPISGGLGLSLHTAGRLRGVITIDGGAARVAQVFIVVNRTSSAELRHEELLSSRERRRSPQPLPRIRLQARGWCSERDALSRGGDGAIVCKRGLGCVQQAALSDRDGA